MNAERSPDRALRWLRQMLLVRRFEEACVEQYSATRIRGFLHLYIGEEAVAVGVLDALTPDDAVVATYREAASVDGRFEIETPIRKWWQSRPGTRTLAHERGVTFRPVFVPEAPAS